MGKREGKEGTRRQADRLAHFGLAISVARRLVEADGGYQFGRRLLGEIRAGCCHRDPCRRIAWITVNPGCGRRKCDVAASLHAGYRKARTVAGLQYSIFSCSPALPDRADSVDDVASRQLVPAGEPRLARCAAAEPSAFREKLGSGGAIDRGVDSATAEE